MTITKTYSGLLSLHSWGEADSILFISSIEDPLARVLNDDIGGRQVSVRYWITDQQITKEQAQKDFLKTLMGHARGKFGSQYNELTGYLWTDEEVTIGGHSLIDELKSHVGKWVILEVDIHRP